MCNIFKKNILQFGYFSSNLSIDETMIKFYGRTQIKQFVKNKPIRFGIKLWSLCTSFGFLLDFNIYCGKSSQDSSEKLQNCTLGTRVVMNLLHLFFRNTPENSLENYHAVFDNFFTNPDLLVHLKSLGLRATGTVRSNRVYENKIVNDKLKRVIVPITLNKKSERGEYSVKHDVNSNINYISVMDSKVVSILSTACGIEPLKCVERYSKEQKKRVSLPFPQTFSLYNKFMGGVDIQDQYCSDLRIKVNKRKWTFHIFKHIIEAAMSNAIIIWNICNEENKRVMGLILHWILLTIT